MKSSSLINLYQVCFRIVLNGVVVAAIVYTVIVVVVVVVAH